MGQRSEAIRACSEVCRIGCSDDASTAGQASARTMGFKARDLQRMAQIEYPDGLVARLEALRQREHKA